MTTTLTPYLSFNGNAREALEFYAAALGGTLTISTYGEFGQNENPADAERVMHGQLEVSPGFTLLGADAPPQYPSAGFGGFSVALFGADDAELRGYWERLQDGGAVVMPLESAPWGDTFGQLTDRYGLSWMINISGAAA